MPVVNYAMYDKEERVYATFKFFYRSQGKLYVLAFGHLISNWYFETNRKTLNVSISSIRINTCYMLMTRCRVLKIWRFSVVSNVILY